jgi:hypothetical protein
MVMFDDQTTAAATLPPACCDVLWYAVLWCGAL